MLPTTLVFLASRACVVLAIVLTVLVADHSDDSLGGRPWPAPANASTAERVETMWDGSWYLEIALQGYPHTATGPFADHLAFFPAFPVLLRGLAEVVPEGALIGSTAVLMLVLGLAGALAVRLLAGELLPAATADRSLALYSFFPGAFVLTLPYSEALMIVGAALGLWCVLRGRWIGAGIATAVVTATRPNGIALLLAVAVAAVVASRRDRTPRPLVAPLIGSVGILGFFAFLWNRTGDPVAWLTSQQHVWHERFRPVFATVDRVRNVNAGIPRGPGGRELNALVGLIFLVVVVLCLVAFIRWRPPLVIAVYTVAVLVLAESSQTLGMRPRFVLTAFPLFFGLAVYLRRSALAAVVGVFAAASTALLAISALTLSLTP